MIKSITGSIVKALTPAPVDTSDMQCIKEATKKLTGEPIESDGYEPEDFDNFAGIDFGPEITQEQADQFEANAVSPEWAFVRMVALGLLTKTKAEVVAGIGPDSWQAMLDASEEINNLADFLKCQSDTVRSAHSRLMIALAAAAKQAEDAAGGAA